MNYCGCRPHITCGRCDRRISNLEFRLYGPGFDVEAADTAADRYERDLRAASGETV